MSEIPSPIDLIDSGADDDEPVKGVTHGHLRQWHDSIEGMSYLLEMLTDEMQRDQDEVDETANKPLEDIQREHADEIARYRTALEHITAYCEAEPQTSAQAVMAKLAREALSLSSQNGNTP